MSISSNEHIIESIKPIMKNFLHYFNQLRCILDIQIKISKCYTTIFSLYFNGILIPDLESHKIYKKSISQIINNFLHDTDATDEIVKILYQNMMSTYIDKLIISNKNCIKILKPLEDLNTLEDLLYTTTYYFNYEISEDSDFFKKLFLKDNLQTLYERSIKLLLSQEESLNLKIKDFRDVIKNIHDDFSKEWDDFIMETGRQIITMDAIRSQRFTMFDVNSIDSLITIVDERINYDLQYFIDLYELNNHHINKDSVITAVKNLHISPFNNTSIIDEIKKHYQILEHILTNNSDISQKQSDHVQYCDKDNLPLNIIKTFSETESLPIEKRDESLNII